MKILLHGVNYAPEPTSTGKLTGEMGEWLAAQGHDVRVVAAPPHYPAWRVKKGYSARAYRRERVAGTEVWRCPVWIPARPTGLKRLLYQGSFAASSSPVVLRQILWRPDVIMVVEPSLSCVPAALLAARLCGSRAWLHIQDFELDAALDLGLLRGRGVQRALYGIEKFLMRRFDGVSTITEAMRRRVVAKGVSEDRTRVVPNWANLESVRPMRRENEAREEFGAGPDDLLVMYAGNMGEKQGLEVVLDAADLLRWRTEIKFALIGDGAARERLERAAEERGLKNVRFWPIQPLGRLPLVLAAGDIQLVVQRREAADLVMPSKLTNILAAGRPCLATTDEGTALYDVLSEHRCGISTEPGNATELAEGIVALANDAPMRERLGSNARAYAESYPHQDKILATFESNLKELAELS
jgi:colanic acid biosynthesis glycosyl transferase WcaI